MGISFTVEAEGTVYRRPTGVQAYYPRLVPLSDRELLVSFVGGEALESGDSHPVLTRSMDGGLTWKLEGAVDDSVIGRFTETGFITSGPPPVLLCVGARWKYDQRRPLVSPDNAGMRANEIVVRLSTDRGHSWSSAVTVPLEIDVPLEVPTGIVVVEGTWLLTVATWKRWDGSAPCGHQVVLTVSNDEGKTWSSPTPVFFDKTARLGFWEARLMWMGGHRLLATCWAHDWVDDTDVRNHFTISTDLGRTWSRARPTATHGQTGRPLWLGNDLLLFVYCHRRDPAGIRGQIARVNEEGWESLYDAEIWGCSNHGTGGISSLGYDVPSFQFGAPSAVHLAGNRVLVVYWSVRSDRAGIDWTELSLSEGATGC